MVTSHGGSPEQKKETMKQITENSYKFRRKRNSFRFVWLTAFEPTMFVG